MARPYNILRPVKFHISLPEDLKAKVDLHLWSQVEQRIPTGKLSEFFTDLARQFFSGGKPIVHETLLTNSTDTAAHAMRGLLTEIALTDLRTGWTPEVVLSFVKRARALTGKVPV